MSDTEFERARLKGKYFDLLDKKQLLNDEKEQLVAQGRDLEEYGEYLHKTQWSNYSKELEQQYELNWKAWNDASQHLDTKLEEIAYQIETIEKDINNERELESALLVNCEHESEKHRVSPISKEIYNRTKCPNKQGESEPYYADAINIPWIISYLLSQEELECWLVDLRVEWYRKKSFVSLMKIRWLIHFRVWFKTWWIVFVQLGIIRLLIEKIIFRFQPLRKPRLPK